MIELNNVKPRNIFSWRKSMNAENIQLFTQYQKQLQEAEKSYQKKVYALQEDVQKLNKAYQNRLLNIDKLFANEEKNHADQLNHIDQSFSKDSKTLTQDAIENNGKYQENLKALKMQWVNQEKTIQAAFDAKLGNKEKELKEVQKERERVAKAIEKEYQESKAKLERVKTVTTEIFEDARSSFENSFGYYLNRLQNGSADDITAYKKEVLRLKKGLKALEAKQMDVKKALLKSNGVNQKELAETLASYQKDLGLLQSKGKAFITRTLKKFDTTFVKNDDDIKKTQSSFRALRKKIFDTIESQKSDDFDLVNQYEASITNDALQTVYSELQSIASAKNHTLTQIYTNMTDWADKILKESLETSRSTSKELQALLTAYGNEFTEFIQASEGLFSHVSAFNQFDGPLDGLFLGHNISALINSLDALSDPLLNAQKKWHHTLLKTYKEAQEYYNELDEIQAFFDSFAEEKALAFENEQVHITRRAAQLDVEVETAKKQYEYDSLNADQAYLFEKNKSDHLIKEYKLQEKTALAQAKATFAVKDLELKNVIAKAKNDYQLKNAFYTVEAEGLEDKKKYRLADIKETYSVKRFDVEKKKAYALYELKLNQNTELDQHAIAVNDAKNLHQRNKETKQLYLNELEMSYSSKRNANILSLKKQIDEFELELKRIDLAEENEIRTLEKVYEDEISVPSNRLKEFDKVILKRLKSINAPYQARLKTFARFEEAINNPNPSVEKILEIVSLKFKDDMLATIDIYYETLKWTREYFSDLEIGKIKRSDLTMKRQGQELDAHQEGERKYLNNLNTYNKAAEQSLLSLFEQIDQQIKKKEFSNNYDLAQGLKNLYRKLLAVLEEQSELTLQEIESLFNYIKDQDEIFMGEVNEGLNSALAKIGQDFKAKRGFVEDQISTIKGNIDATKSAPLLQLSLEESGHLEGLENELKQSEKTLQDLDYERQRKIDRFKSEVQSLDHDFNQQVDNVDYQYQLAIEAEVNEIQSDNERIEEKRLYAEKTFERIQDAQKVQLNHYKKILETARVDALAKTQEKTQAREDRLAEIERVKERKMIDVESKLNLTLDDIQKEISSREIQLETAKEKVERQYDSLYFDYQNRAQMLNEKLNRLQKYIFTERESILNQMKLAISQVHETLQLNFEETVALKNAASQFDGHMDNIDVWIKNKKDAFKASL